MLNIRCGIGNETSRPYRTCEIIEIHKRFSDMNHDRVKLLGDYLRQRRLELRLSARRVGQLSGVNYQTVIRIENGEFARPGVDKIKAIAETLELSLNSVWEIIGYGDARLPEPLPYL